MTKKPGRPNHGLKPKIKISIRVDSELLSKIDAITPNRSKLIEAAVVDYLGRKIDLNANGEVLE